MNLHAQTFFGPIFRDIKDTTVGSLSQRITNQLMGIKGLNVQLKEVCKYLQMVVDGKLPINHQIIYQLQDVFNLLPDVQLQEFVKSVYVKTNDQMLVVSGLLDIKDTKTFKVLLLRMIGQVPHWGGFYVKVNHTCCIQARPEQVKL